MLKKILLLIIWAISLTLASCEDTKEPELIDCDRVCGRVFGFAIQDSDGNNLLLQDTPGSFTDKNISIEFFLLKEIRQVNLLSLLSGMHR